MQEQAPSIRVVFMQQQQSFLEPGSLVEIHKPWRELGVDTTAGQVAATRLLSCTYFSCSYQSPEAPAKVPGDQFATASLNVGDQLEEDAPNVEA